MKYYNDMSSKDWAALIAWLALLVGGVSFALAQPYFEARQYEQMTGKEALYWDAFWLDLRVVNESK